MTAADTKGLEIPDCVIPLCINGKEFRLYATSGLSDTLVALAEEAVRLSVLTKDGNRSSVTVKFLERAIDGILGDGNGVRSPCAEYLYTAVKERSRELLNGACGIKYGFQIRKMRPDFLLGKLGHSPG